MAVGKALQGARMIVLNYLQTTRELNVVKTQIELGDAHKAYSDILKMISKRTNLKRYYAALIKSIERELSIIDSLYIASTQTKDARAFMTASDAYLNKLQGEIEIENECSREIKKEKACSSQV